MAMYQKTKKLQELRDNFVKERKRRKGNCKKAKFMVVSKRNTYKEMSKSSNYRSLNIYKVMENVLQK